MNLTIRRREGMPAILKDGPNTIATIKDDRYVGLLASVGQLQEDLLVAVGVMEALNCDVTEFKQTLEASKVLGKFVHFLDEETQ